MAGRLVLARVDGEHDALGGLSRGGDGIRIKSSKSMFCEETDGTQVALEDLVDKKSSEES